MSKFEDIQKIDRPELGAEIPLTVFRAFRHFSSDYVEKAIGRGVEAVFQMGGRELGREVGASVLCEDLEEYVSRVHGWVRDSKIGLLKPVTLESDKIILALDECITCAGMDSLGKRICHFEVGLVGGAVEAFVGKRVRAIESKCNANGEDTCEVTVTL